MNPQEILQLKDIHFPESPSIWPLAIGWWLLILLLLMVVIYLFFVIRNHSRIQKHRKILFNEYATLEQKLKDSPSKDLIAETNILLRRLALAYYPNQRVASLTGDAWLNFLNKTGQTDRFTNGVGRILIEAPYQPGQLENFHSEKFREVISNWVKKTAYNKQTKRAIRAKHQKKKNVIKVGGCP